VLRERYLAPGEHTVDDVRHRVAIALASVESPRKRADYADIFLQAMRAGFIPGGRIQAAAGLQTAATLINCFVQPVLPPMHRAAWHEGVRQAMVTMAAGGGVGYDLSDLPPRNDPHSLQEMPGLPSPLEFLDLMEQRVAQAIVHRDRRAAQMAVLRIDHPDVIAFIQRKRSGGLAHFNLSVSVTDASMDKAFRDEIWDLRYQPKGILNDQVSDRSIVYNRLPARHVMQQLQDATYACGEPGVIFIDQVNRDEGVTNQAPLRAANPCGEQFLPDYGACNLGSIDLTRFVRSPFSLRAQFDLNRFADVARVAVRALDNVIELTHWPLPEHVELARRQRRIGLGFTGLGDALFMLGLRYDSSAGCAFAARVARCLRDAACEASIRLAMERSSFPDLDALTYLTRPRAGSRLPEHLRRRIQQHGIRNSHRLSIAPTGSISLAFADNVSPGIEPIMGPQIWHRGRGAATDETALVADHAWRLFRSRFGGCARLPPAFLTAADVSPTSQLRMLASVTPFVDAGISKTISIPTDYPRAAFDPLMRQAWLMGVKAFTCYRLNPNITPAMSTTSPDKRRRCE
jgi:ribonucleoside-diphosphate reductase alpha chain